MKNRALEGGTNYS